MPALHSPVSTIVDAKRKMAVEPVRRRPAAILAADVLGYSRLVREDEEGTLSSV
jgi:class 3 adenylate cyclase